MESKVLQRLPILQVLPVRLTLHRLQRPMQSETPLQRRKLLKMKWRKLRRLKLKLLPNSTPLLRTKPTRKLMSCQ